MHILAEIVSRVSAFFLLLFLASAENCTETNKLYNLSQLVAKLFSVHTDNASLKCLRLATFHTGSRIGAISVL